MKLLPCRTKISSPQGPKNCGSYAEMSRGEPYIVGNTLPHFPFTYHCGRCKLKSVLSATDFARLPKLTLENIRDFGLVERYAKDFVGQGLKHEHAEDLMNVGIMSPNDRELAPREAE